MAVRAAASLCVHLGARRRLRDAAARRAPPGRDRPRPGRVAGVHARLALVEAGAAPPAGVAGPRGGAVIWVTAAGGAGAPRGARAHARRRALSWCRRARCRGRAAAVRGRRLHRLPGRARAARGGGMSALRRPRLPPRCAPRRSPPGRDRGVARARLATFAALALFAAGTGSRSSSPPGGAHAARAVLVARHRRLTLAALGRAPLTRRSAPRRSPRPRRGACSGWPLALAWRAGPARCACSRPAHWGELVDGLDRGLAGVQHVDWPYDGPDAWVRLTILLGAPLASRLSAAARLLPRAPGRRRCLRLLGLVALLVALRHGRDRARPGPAAAARPGPAPARRRLAVAAARCVRARRWPAPRWCWRWARCRCRSPPRSTASGPGGTTARGPGSGTARTITFDWTHRYGPLNWPRDGTTLLNVKSDARTTGRRRRSTRFDGLRWMRGRDRATRPRRRAGPAPPRRRPLGLLRVEPQVGRDAPLHGSLAVHRACSWSAGTPYVIRGRRAGLDRGATARPSWPTPLKQGDSYTVSTYVPEPVAGRRCAGARAAPAGLADRLHDDRAARARGEPRGSARLRCPRVWRGRGSSLRRPGRRRGARSPRRSTGDMYGIALAA